MVRGRTVVVAMFLVGGGLLGGYEVVRRLSAPVAAESLEDLGAATGTFDRTYRFRDEVYRVRAAAGAASGAGTIVVSLRRPDGTESPTAARESAGELVDAHFLELARGEPPTIVAIARSADGRSVETAFRREGDEIRAWPLEPLPEELRARYRGGDLYDRQGALLYRKLELAPASPGEEPRSMRFFYDFKNERWVASG